jgi:hypothetical protein
MLANITSDPASPSPAPSAPKLKRSVQNQAIQNYIGEAETFILTVTNDAEIHPVMDEHGYDAAELAIGNGLLQTAANAFGVRLTGIAGKTDLHEDLQTADEKARDDYAAFRLVARAAFPAQSDRVGLGLTGNVPHDLQKFITLAHTSYTNAAKPEWTTKMSRRGYAPARLTTLNAAISALTGTESEAAISAGDAVEDTKARDDAYIALKDWIKEAHGVARGAFRGNDGALTKLKL